MASNQWTRDSENKYNLKLIKVCNAIIEAKLLIVAIMLHVREIIVTYICDFMWDFYGPKSSKFGAIFAENETNCIKY